MKKITILFFAALMSSCTFDKAHIWGEYLSVFTSDSIITLPDLVKNDSLLIITEETKNGVATVRREIYKRTEDGRYARTGRSVESEKESSFSDFEIIRRSINISSSDSSTIFVSPQTSKSTDDSQLLLTAMSDDDVSSRLHAVTLLKDENSIIQVAMSDEEPEVRKLAVTMLKDENNIMHVAFSESETDIQKLAVSMLKDQNNLKHIVYSDVDADVRKVALYKLASRSDIEHLARFDKDNEIRKSASQMLAKIDEKKK